MILRRYRFAIVVFAAVLIIGVAISSTVRADVVRIAVASNFSRTMAALTAAFEAEHTHQIIIATGSTGKHFAQISHGAPFDAFFAADRRRPMALEEEQLTVDGSRFTYAIGQLVLWSPRADFVDSEGRVLDADGFNHLALANPKLAPYGAAAKQVLTARNRWDAINARIVRGENVTQAYQFVHSGNAELGFIAYSQIINGVGPIEGSWWQPPSELYSAIEQQAVQLRESAAAAAFMTFVRSERGRAIIVKHGYGVP